MGGISAWPSLIVLLCLAWVVALQHEGKNNEKRHRMDESVRDVAYQKPVLRYNSGSLPPLWQGVAVAPGVGAPRPHAGAEEEVIAKVRG